MIKMIAVVKAIISGEINEEGISISKINKPTNDINDWYNNLLFWTTFQTSNSSNAFWPSSGIINSFLYIKMKKKRVKIKTIKDISPTLIKNSKNSIPAYVVIKMFGIEEIEKTVPPTFTNTAWVNMYGEGFMFKILETVIVSGIIIITVKMLFKIADIKTVTTQKIIIKLTGFPPDSFINFPAINWNDPASWAICTIIIVPIIIIKECKLTNPSEGDPNSNSTIIEKSKHSINISTKYVIIAPSREEIARFNLLVIINKITAIKHAKIMIILIIILSCSFIY